MSTRTTWPTRRSQAVKSQKLERVARPNLRQEGILSSLLTRLFTFFFFSSRFLICARTPKIFLVHYSISGKYDYISHSIPAINRNDRQLKFKKKVQITSHMDQIHDERHSYPGRISRSSSRNRFPDDHETDTLVVRCTRRLTIRLRFNQQGVGCRTGAQS